MPALLTPPSTGKSFADLVPDLVGLPEDRASSDDADVVTTIKPEESAKPDPKTGVVKSADDPDTKGADTKIEPGANPHLEADPEPVKVLEKPAVPAEDEVPKGMTKKAEETWKSLKQAEKAAVAGLAEAQTELAATKKQLEQQREESGKNTPEIERLKKENEEVKARLAEYEGDIAVTRVEATKAFKEMVSGPIRASEELVKALATKYQVGETALLEAIREPDASRRADLIDELSADFKLADRLTMVDAAKSYAAASQAGKEMREKADSKLAEIDRETKANADQIAAANTTDFRKAAGSAWKVLQEQFPILGPVEGNPQWNSYLDSIGKEIEALDVNDIPVAEVAQMRAQSRVLPEVAKALTHFQKVAKDEREKRLVAEERLREFRKTEPGAGSGASVQTEPGAVTKFADLPI